MNHKNIYHPILTSVLKQFLVFVFFTLVLNYNALLAFDMDFYEKPQFVTYKFSEEKLPRHSFVRFPQSGIMISSFCIYSAGKVKRGRECLAWKPYEYVLSGNLVSMIREKGFFSEGDSPRQIAYLVCKESGGTTETEAYELNFYGRQVEMEDFCAYKDGSMTSYNFILLYIYKKGPNIKTEIEKIRNERNKLLKANTDKPASP